VALSSIVHLFRRKPRQSRTVRRGIAEQNAGEFQKAFQFFHKAAISGDAEGSYRTGIAYLKGEGILPNLGDAINWLKDAAEKEHIQAQYQLSLCYLQSDSDSEPARWYSKTGISGKSLLFPNRFSETPQPEESFRWCHKAAEAGLSDAQAQLGVLYLHGIGVEADPEAARLWYERAAEQDNAKAEFGLGVIHENGLGVAIDEAKAAEWYQRASDHGSGDASVALSLLYKTGRGVAQDQTVAVALLLPHVAQANNPRAQYLLGLHLLEGAGVPQDRGMAESCLRKAALASYVPAMIALARFYEKGQETAHWWRAAADTGNTDAQFAVGVLYAKGDGVPERPDLAFEWFKKAAEKGHAAAQFNVGICLYQGTHGISRDPERAAVWLLRAAEQGLAGAQIRLAQLYYNGEGVPKDIEKTTEWLKKAALTGSAEAEALLAGLYISGTGVPQNIPEAQRLLQSAANRGYGPAQMQLKRITQAPAPPQVTASAPAMPVIRKEPELPPNVTRIGRSPFILTP
jgi:TPR repeat protein